MLSKEPKRIELVAAIQIHFYQESKMILQSSDEYKIQEENQLLKDKQLQQTIT